MNRRHVFCAAIKRKQTWMEDMCSGYLFISIVMGGGNTQTWMCLWTSIKDQFINYFILSIYCGTSWFCLIAGDSAIQQKLLARFLVFGHFSDQIEFSIFGLGRLADVECSIIDMSWQPLQVATWTSGYLHDLGNDQQPIHVHTTLSSKCTLPISRIM